MFLTKFSTTRRGPERTWLTGHGDSLTLDPTDRLTGSIAGLWLLFGTFINSDKLHTLRYPRHLDLLKRLLSLPEGVSKLFRVIIPLGDCLTVEVIPAVITGDGGHRVLTIGTLWT